MTENRRMPLILLAVLLAGGALIGLAMAYQQRGPHPGFQTNKAAASSSNPFGPSSGTGSRPATQGSTTPPGATTATPPGPPGDHAKISTPTTPAGGSGLRSRVAPFVPLALSAASAAP